jgi:hypothetical protein
VLHTLLVSVPSREAEVSIDHLLGYLNWSVAVFKTMSIFFLLDDILTTVTQSYSSITNTQQNSTTTNPSPIPAFFLALFGHLNS